MNRNFIEEQAEHTLLQFRFITVCQNPCCDASITKTPFKEVLIFYEVILISSARKR